MTDPRLNRRAPRGRDGRARDHLESARWHMRVWVEWVTSQQDRGWPRESSEVRASASRQAQTNLTGTAAYRGRVQLAGGKWAAKEPPPMPKETRPSGRARIPDIDRARIGPMVDRLLRDMDGIGPRRSEQAQALRSWAMLGGSTTKVAEALLVDERTCRRRVRRGLEWLAERLTWVPLERRSVLHVEQSASAD